MKPVSYTHLDVYKRQALGYTLLSQKPIDLFVLSLGVNDLKFVDAITAGEGTKKILQMILDADAVFNGQRTGIFRHAPKTVSYTHLDVYKRQDFIRRARLLDDRGNYDNYHSDSRCSNWNAFRLFQRDRRFGSSAYNRVVCHCSQHSACFGDGGVPAVRYKRKHIDLVHLSCFGIQHLGQYRASGAWKDAQHP